MLEKVREKISSLGKPKQDKKIAVFIDGPNILRRELKVDLSEVKKILQKFGKIKIGKVFLNQYASDKLVEAVVNQGFEPVITVGDIDVSMAADAVEAVYNPHIDVIAFVTRDSDFLPALIKAKRNGKETVVILAEEASAVALKNNADYVIVMPKLG
ncbi:MAG: TIGR00288 family NYN domain-containing protein [Candidatus Diapherotrites archaeon]|nr:TIGR00288 family NYN domain-containing protein [Candidatus Diapherotrites archaeon]